MKKIVYITVWIIGGALFSFIVHGVVEIPVIFLFIKYKQAMFGLSWKTWELIHNILTPLLFFGGAWFGWQMGIKFWKKIYEKS